MSVCNYVTVGKNCKEIGCENPRVSEGQGSGGWGKEKLKTAGSSLLEYGADTVRCRDKRYHMLHSRCREVLILTPTVVPPFGIDYQTCHLSVGFSAQH